MPPPSPSKTVTLDSSTLFISSYKSFSALSSQTNPPISFNLLSVQSPLPPIPPNFPQSKRIPKTRFVVDGFKSSGDFSVSYFLSHFHADHYAGLGPTWSKGMVFCSDTTARLLVEILNVSPLFVVSLPLNENVMLDDCDVTLIDANHCPGAVQFLFKVRDERYIHTGDFRFSSSMKADPALKGFVGADAVFLDTTYCHPKWVFPSQDESIEYVVKTIERIRTENRGLGNSILFLVSTYIVGKEKILLEISRRCHCSLHVDSRKITILRVLGFADCGFFTEDVSGSDVHVVGWNVLGETWPYFRPNFVKMKEIMVERGYSMAVGFVPTGWMYGAKRDGFAVKAKDSCEIHLVPYSEHSSYDELIEYVRILRPKQVIPTVGLDVEKLDSKHAASMRKHFVGLVDEMANKQEFLMGFRRRLHEIDEKEAGGIGVDPSKEAVMEKEDDMPLTDMDCPLQDKYIGMVEELHDCLPKWVTQEQMLDLLSRSGGDIVEAVSDFYERETELHEEAVANSMSVTSCQTSLPKLSSQPEIQSSIDITNEKITIRQDKKTPNTNCSIRSTISPRKRGTGTGHKPRKKARPSSTSESGGCKQSTITSFFSKLLPDVSQFDRISNATAEQRINSGNLPLNDAVGSNEELDQFLQIVNGTILRGDAALLLEKAKGDFNLALDMHYGNSIGVLNNKEGNSELCGTSVQSQCDITGKESNYPEERKNVANESAEGFSAQDTGATFVSLSVEKYCPIEHACWRAGHPAPYLHIARTFDLVEQERGKIKATSMLCNMFRSLLALSPEDVLPAVYLCTNKIAADNENVELNIGGSLVSAALEEACGTNRSKIRDMYNDLGDLGDVAQQCRQTQSLLAPPHPLSIRGVFSVLRKISIEAGSGSTVRKKNLIVNLMRSCREREMKFLVRTLVRNLRIGAMMRTILPALAQAVALNSSTHLLGEGAPEGLKMQLQGICSAVVEAYNILPNLDLLVPSLVCKGIEFSASTLSMTPGIPIKPMLARTTNGINQVMKLFRGRAFTCEYKYDGQRAQIHKLMDGSVQVFSRNGEETTSRFPDVVNIVREACKPVAKTLILDAEVVAVDRKNGSRLMSFQQLSSRERGGKYSSIPMDRIKVDICIFAFDVMFANGEQLLAFPLRQRRRYLKDLFYGAKLGHFEFAKEITVEAEEACLNNQATLAKMNSFLEDSFNSSCEGVIVKSLDDDAGYAASKRTDTWLKVKRDYLEGLNDSLDLVPIGAWHGNGRKAGWYSPFLMACFDSDTEEFQSVCRVMSGFSDAFYREKWTPTSTHSIFEKISCPVLASIPVEMKEFFSGDKILCKKPPYYQTAEVPDMWFSPELVWEIRGADFTISPVHQAAFGIVHPSRGISIRFPRFIQSVSDRKPEDCSTATDIVNMFRSQTRKMEVGCED